MDRIKKRNRDHSAWLTSNPERSSLYWKVGRPPFKAFEFLFHKLSEQKWKVGYRPLKATNVGTRAAGGRLAPLWAHWMTDYQLSTPCAIWDTGALRAKYPIQTLARTYRVAFFYSKEGLA